MNRRRLATTAAIGLMLLAGCRASGNVAPSIPFSPFAATHESTSARNTVQPQWIPVGPRLVAGWSGKVNAFAYVPSDPKVMYIGGGWGDTPRESPSQMGIYKTVDGGAHSMPVVDGLTNSDGTISSVVNGLWLDPARPSIVLAATEFGGTFRWTRCRTQLA